LCGYGALTADKQQTYKLEVIALSDGYKDYDEVMVKIVPGKIESIFHNPANDMVIVGCVFNNVSDAYLTISNVIGIIHDNYDLDLIAGSQTIIFDIPHYQTGTYVVTLYCDGVAVDSKTFVKQ